MTQVAYSIAEAAASTGTTEAIIKEAVHDGLLLLRRAGQSTPIILHGDLTTWAEGLPAFSRPGVVRSIQVVSAAG